MANCDSFVQIKDIRYSCILERGHSGLIHKNAQDIYWKESQYNTDFVQDSLAAAKKAGKELAKAYKDCKENTICNNCGMNIYTGEPNLIGNRLISVQKILNKYIGEDGSGWTGMLESERIKLLIKNLKRKRKK